MYIYMFLDLCLDNKPLANWGAYSHFGKWNHLQRSQKNSQWYTINITLTYLNIQKTQWTYENHMSHLIPLILLESKIRFHNSPYTSIPVQMIPNVSKCIYIWYTINIVVPGCPARWLEALEFPLSPRPCCLTNPRVSARWRGAVLFCQWKASHVKIDWEVLRVWWFFTKSSIPWRCSFQTTKVFFLERHLCGELTSERCGPFLIHETWCVPSQSTVRCIAWSALAPANLAVN